MRIILVSHDGLAASFKSTAEMIAGPQPLISAFGVEPACDIDGLQAEIAEQIEEYISNGEEVLILTDLFFGTPFNMVVHLMSQFPVLHLTGINLPMLLEIATSAESASLDQIADMFAEQHAGSMMNVNEALAAMEDDED